MSTPLRVNRRLLLGVFKWLGKTVGKIFDRAAGSGMSDAEKESSALSLRNQQELNQQEYDRKLDFYNRFESPLAQVLQYKNAGLNPMLLGDGSIVSSSGGIGSAGSAPASTSAGDPSIFVSLLGTLLNFKAKQRQLDIENKAIDIQANRLPSEIHRNLGSGEASFARADEIRLLASKKAEQLDAQTSVYKEDLNLKKVQEELARADISKKEADAALSIRQEALLAIQEQYNDKYWENTVLLQDYEMDLKSATASRNRVEARYLEQQITNLITENDNMLKEGIGIVLENGKLAHEFDILGKEAANTDKRIRQENAARVIHMVTDCVDSAVGVVGAASGVGGAMATMSRAASYRRQTDYNVSRPYYRQR